MAWVATVTFTTGNVLTAAQMNSYSRDNLNFLHSPPGCLAVRTTAQVISTGVTTLMSFNGTDVYDSDSMHDPVGAPSNIVFNTLGVYLVSVSLQFAANGTGARWMTVDDNVASVSLGGAKDSGPTSGITSSLTTSMPYKVTSLTSLLQVSVQQTSGGNLSVTNAGTNTLTGATPSIQFGAQWISDGS